MSSEDLEFLQGGVAVIGFYNMLLPVVLFMPILFRSDLLRKQSGRAISDPILKIAGVTVYFLLHSMAAFVLLKAVNAKNVTHLWLYIYYTAGETILTCVFMAIFGNFMKLSPIVLSGLAVIQTGQLYAVYALIQGIAMEIEMQKAMISSIINYVSSLFSKSGSQSE